MTCFRIDASIATDARTLKAGNGAIGAWVRMTSWSHEYETDGVIPRRLATNIASEEEVLSLLETGLLKEHGDDFALVDYLKGNPSKAQLERARAKWRERGKLTPALRREMILAALACGICGETLFEGDEIHVDHVVPMAKGGRTEPSNLQVAHAACNLKKGAS
jgi:hypothetical protein